MMNAKTASKMALGTGLVALALLGFGMFQGASAGDSRASLSLILGAAFWLSILIGSLMFIMISYIFGGRWMTVLRRQLEFMVGGFKWLFVILLPLVILAAVNAHNPSLPWIWMNPEALIPGGHTVGHDPLYFSKSGYLNVSFFIIRYLLYFGVWVGLAELFRYHSFKMDNDGDPAHFKWAYRLSCVGIPATAFVLTFFAFDWMKSLEYHWFSTMFGVWYFAASIRAAIAFMVLLGAYLGSRGYLKGLYKSSHSYLLGCLLLAFTVFWAYISFSQYFLQYNANIPEEVYWYHIRELSHGHLSSWWWVSMVLVFGSFLFPFLWLLFYRNKFSWKIAFIAVWILLMDLIDIYWNVLPQKLYSSMGHYEVRAFSVTVYDLAALLGIGAILLWSFLRSVQTTQTIPVRDPGIKESLNCHE